MLNIWPLTALARHRDARAVAAAADHQAREAEAAVRLILADAQAIRDSHPVWCGPTEATGLPLLTYGQEIGYGGQEFGYGRRLGTQR